MQLAATGPAPRDAVVRLWRPLRPLFGFALFAAALTAFWHYFLVAFDVPHYVMPSPARTWQAFAASEGRILAHTGFTVRSALTGLVISTAVALSLAAVFVNSRTVTRAVLPLVIGLRTIPIVAIAPLIILIFGRDMGSSIAVVVISSFFPIMVNGMRGFGSTPANNLELMHVYGATRAQLFFKVRVPFALPFIFTGLRIASAAGMLSAMLAEWLSGAPGLGLLILDSAALSDYEVLWSAVIISMLLAFIVFGLTAAAERRFAGWARAPGR